MSGGSKPRVVVAVVGALAVLVTATWSGPTGAQEPPAGDGLHAELDVPTSPVDRRASEVELTDSLLRDAVERAQANETLPGGVQSAGDAVLVEVHSSLPTAELTAIVEQAGGTVHGGVDSWFVEAFVPFGELEGLEAHPDIDHVQTPTRADLRDDAGGVQAGSTTGEHIAKTNSSAWNAAGITGAGVKVGVIDFFDDAAWDAARAGRDVPTAAGTVCRSSGSNCDIFASNSAHGVAVAEIVHDVAPAAQIYLATATTTADLDFVVDWLLDRGVKIITRSLGTELDGPGDGTGPTAAIVDEAVARGATWFNSAGNKGGKDSTQPGSYWRGTWSDTDNDGYLNFGPTDNTMGFICGYLQGVRWDDWGANPTDYDVEVYVDFDNDGILDTPAYGGSADDQAGGADPVETGIACAPGTVNYLAIALFDPGNGTAGDVLEVHLNAGILEYWQNPYSVTQPAADSDSPGMVTVGAIGDNPAGTSLAYYSSRGPTNDGRVKPDLSAASCVATVAFGSQCFNGTSAATPVAAGVAALVLDAGLASTPAQVKRYLVDLAVDRGPAGTDQAYGAGELILPGGLESLTPVRVFDTRPGQSPDALRSVPKQQISGSTTLKVKVADLPGRVPASGVGAVSLNVVATGSTQPGYLTVYPCNKREEVSSLNFGAGQTVANAVVAPVSDKGTICIYSPVPVDVIADLNGWFETTSAFAPVSPERVFDTRPGQSSNALRSVPKRQIDRNVLEVELTDLPGVVPATGVEAVSLNVVATGSRAPGYITAYPCGKRKEVSSVNFAAGATVANAVTAPVSADGTVCFYTSTAVDIVVDINGWFASSPVFTPLSPERLLDTRPGQSPDALRDVDKRQVGGSYVLTAKVSPLGKIVPADGVAAVSLNVVATSTSGPGYATVYPCGTPPTVSSVNFSGAGQTVANAVVAPVSSTGMICLLSSTPIDLVVDINGWYAG